MGVRRLILLLLSAVLLTGCARAPEAALQELKQLNLSYSEERFLQSAREGDAKAARLYLEAGMDPNTADEHGVTALMLAAASGNFQNVRQLLGAGANPQVRNAAGWTALTYAERNGRAEVAALLEKAGAGGSQQEFRAELAKLGLTYDPNQFPSVARSRPDAILIYVGAGADPNARGQNGVTPLMAASAADRPEVVRGLLSLGADVEARDAGGWTALHYAEAGGADRVAALLQQAGAIGARPHAEGEIGRLLPDSAPLAPRAN